jgi:hypothetical protein
MKLLLFLLTHRVSDLAEVGRIVEIAAEMSSVGVLRRKLFQNVTLECGGTTN